MVISCDFLKARETINIPLPCKMARNTKFLGSQSDTQITKVPLLHPETQMFPCAGRLHRDADPWGLTQWCQPKPRIQICIRVMTEVGKLAFSWEP